MNRSGVSRASGSGAAAAASLGPVAKLGDSKLLRTKHIDTLEVLETYSQDMARLTKENKALANQLSKYSSMGGDPFARISTLESILAVERESNAEMAGRIQMLAGETERHRSEQSLRESSLRDAQSQLASLRAELSSLSATHASCISARQALSESVAALSKHNGELGASVARHDAQVEEYKSALEAQSQRLRQLEIQAAVGPPLPLAQPSAAAADADGQTARTLRAKAAKSKEKLREKETQLARQLEELTQLHAQLAAASAASAEQSLVHKALTEAHKKQGAELAQAISMQQQAAASARKQVAAAASKDKDKDELARKERAWGSERRDLLAQLDAAHQSIQTLEQQQQAAIAPPARAPSKSEQEQRELVLHLQSEITSLRAQLDHTQSQNQLLRAEHTKVSAAFNRVLAAGGGVGGGGAGPANSGGGGGGGLGNTITIASRKGSFPEFVKTKRENEALNQQVAELRHAVLILQNRLAQAMQQQNQGQQQTQQQTQAQPQQGQQVRPAPSSGALSSSKSLALIAAHEQVHGVAGGSAQPPPQSQSVSASASSSVSASSRHASAAPPHGAIGGVTVASGVPMNKRSSGGGWPTAAIPASSSGAGRVRR